MTKHHASHPSSPGKKSAKWKRRLLLERLESRLPKHAGSITDNDLTISFVPDGTDVGGNPSQLFAELQQTAPTKEWQDIVVKAFETWSDWIGRDINVVQDSGDEMGAEGESSGDPRFGDVRIAAVPMTSDVFAIAVPLSAQVGTWAGDILFNSDAPALDRDDLFAVALHEAGHVLGLDHSDNPNSPMYAHGIPESPTPTRDDIVALQQMYDQVPGRGQGAGKNKHHDEDAPEGEHYSPVSSDHPGNGSHDHELPKQANGNGKGGAQHDASANTVEEILSPLLQASLNSQNNIVVQTFHVSQPELVQLVLETSSNNDDSELISATVLSSSGQLISRLDSNSQSDPVLLLPGTYTVLLEADTQSGGLLLDTDVSLYGKSYTLPLGPGVSDPTGDPVLPDYSEFYPTPGVVITDPVIMPSLSYSLWLQSWWF